MGVATLMGRRPWRRPWAAAEPVSVSSLLKNERTIKTTTYLLSANVPRLEMSGINI